MFLEKAATINDKIKIFGIETWKINPEDTIIVTFDIDIWDVEEVSSMIKIIGECFPKNTIIAKFTGIELEVKAEDYLSSA